METTRRATEVEIALEESDGGTWRDTSAAGAATSVDPDGTGRFRFVGRLRDDTVTIFVGSPFSMPRASLSSLADDVEVDLDARVRLGELDSALSTGGWRYLPDRGRNWWSLRYTRS
jgi:hypothetical protein